MELKSAGGGSGTSVSDAIFGATYNETLVHQVVTAYLAGGRSGNAAQKNRAQVSGGGAKPWRQKGTGNSRAGTSRSPIWTGGGVTFAARKRDYTQKVNRKMYRAAMRSILSKAAEEGVLMVSDDITPAEPKTKLLKEKLAAMEVTNALLLVDEVNEALYLAARNIPNIEVIDAEGVDPVSLLRHHNIIADSAALKKLEERLS